MKNFRFLEWNVYKDAQEMFFEIRGVVSKSQSPERNYLGSQILRSSLSVVLNIAEGSGKSSEKEFIRFLDIALGSLYETRAATELLHKIGNLSRKEIDHFEIKMVSITKQLGGLRRNAKAKLAR